MKDLLTKIFSVMLLVGNSFAQAPDTMWTKTFGGIYDDYASSVKQTTDGGYIITGTTESFGAGSSDVWLIKTDTLGDTIWTKTFGGIDNDFGRSVQQTKDGGYIISGDTKPFGSSYPDVWLIKTNASGDTLWTKTFGGSSFDYGLSIQQTTDNGYIITGYTYSFGAGSSDLWLIKTNASGDTVWIKTFGGNDWDWGFSVQQSLDGGYIITGGTNSFNAGYSDDIWLIKTDASGDTLWTKTFGGSDYDEGYSVQQTNDVSYIVAGFTRSFDAGAGDVWLIKTDAFGDTLWTKTIGGIGLDDALSIQETIDGGYIIIGTTESFGAGAGDVWLIKTTPDVSNIKQNTDLITLDFSLHQNYPNPFNPSTKISWQVPIGSQQTLKIYDVLGNEVATLVDEYKPAGTYEVEWNANNNPSGIYFYQLKAEGFVETKKMILMK